MATVIWHKSTDEENNTVAMFAASKLGSGRVIVDDAVLAVGQWLDAT